MPIFSRAAERQAPPAKRRFSFWRFLFRHLQSLTLAIGVAVILAVVIAPQMVITVPTGHLGVLWKRFNGIGIYCWCFVGRGTVLAREELRQEGLHVIWPWDKLFIYDLRLQSVQETYNVISKDGVSLTADMNIRFQVKNDSVAVLHKFVGPDYEASIVRPEVGSLARQIVSKYTAEEVYSTSRQAIEDEIRLRAEERLGENLNRLMQPGASEQPDPEQYSRALKHSIDFIDTLVLGIELPTSIMDAINRKTEQYYLVQEYQYRVEREVKESIRKQIEANGIAAFQKTVSTGISDSYLRWRGIEATLELAQSKNAKVVIVGSGKDGLPIILGNVDGPPAATGAEPRGGENPSPGAKPNTTSAPGEPGPTSPPAETVPAPPRSTSETSTPPAGKAPAANADSPSGDRSTRRVISPR